MTLSRGAADIGANVAAPSAASAAPPTVVATEHVDDPFAFCAELERRADLVVVNLLEGEDAEHPMHRALPIAALRDRAAAAGLRSSAIHHGRSHLIAYEPGSAGAIGRARGRALVAAARARRRPAYM